MSWYTVLGIAVVGGAGVAVWFSVPLVRTGYLIMRTSPYEQTSPQPSARVHVLGDSTGYGTGATASSYSVAGRVGNDYPQVIITNDSVNGRTIAGGLAALQATTFMSPPDLLLIQLGGNDILGEQATTEVEPTLRALLTLASAQAERVILLAAGNVGGSPRYRGTAAATLYQERSIAFDSMFRAVAAETGTIFISLYEPPGTDPFVAEPKRYLAVDGLHPSNAGYAYWYEQLAPQLRGVLADERHRR